MKKITFSIFIWSIPVLLIVLISWQGCDSEIVGTNNSLLDRSPSDQTEEQFFTTEANFDRAVVGIYAKTIDWYSILEFRVDPWIHYQYYLMGDDITYPGGSNFETFHGITPGNVGSSFWDISYTLINRSNIVLEHLDNEDGVYTNQNLKDYHRGEALFLRGLGHFYLWNYFGALAPLRTERIKDPANTQPESSNPNDPWDTALLDSAIGDFNTAAGLLPPVWDIDNLGRATNNAAYGFLGMALVYRASFEGNNQDYTDAISAIDSIHDRELMQNFGDNFSFLQQNNTESLFEIQAVANPGTDNVWLGNDFNFEVGSQSVWWGFYEEHPNMSGNPSFHATQKLVDTYDTGDPRIEYSIDLDSQPEPNRFIKYTIENGYTGAAHQNNPRLLRYAEALLFKAEAILESGGSTSEAINLINQIRERARNTATPASATPADRDINETDRDVIFQWIMKERSMELAGETPHRWWDLRRWHQQGKINLAEYDFSSMRDDHAIEIPKHLFLPIPQNERDLNANIGQHEGY